MNDSVAFRPDNPLVADLKVRQALLHATNTKEVVETLFSANYPQATAVISSAAAGYINIAPKLAYMTPISVTGEEVAGRSGLEYPSAPTASGRRAIRNFILAAHESPPQPQNKAVLQLISQQWAKVGVKLERAVRRRRQRGDR